MLAAFDFDLTIVSDNSDVVVRNLLKANAPPFNKEKGWTSYMQEIFTMLAGEGTGEKEIRNAIATMDEVDAFSMLLTFLNEKGVEVIIISDSNEYFIHEWLVANGHNEKVKRVFTNPAAFKDGELQIQKYHVQDWCKLCSKNLCKGHVLENYVNERKAEGVAFSRIMYVGDGNNDYCPILKLNSDDVAFPREGYGLMQILGQRKERSEVKAKIITWNSHRHILAYIEANMSL